MTGDRKAGLRYKVRKRRTSGAILARRTNYRHGVIFPQVGSWYRRLDGRLFEVVAVDDEELTVEIQYFDGTIGELDFDLWHGLELEPAAAPEDYSGSLDLDGAELKELRGASEFGWHDHLEFVDHLE